MRLPGNVEGTTPRAHYLTDAYIKQFNLPTKAFPNYDENGLTYIYGFPTTKSSGMYVTDIFSAFCVFYESFKFPIVHLF